MGFTVIIGKLVMAPYSTPKNNPENVNNIMVDPFIHGGFPKSGSDTYIMPGSISRLSEILRYFLNGRTLQTFFFFKSQCLNTMNLSFVRPVLVIMSSLNILPCMTYTTYL